MNTPINNGGPAFPVPTLVTPTGEVMPATAYHDVNGMSLRDYFAGQALAGLCANSALFVAFEKIRPVMLKAMSSEECDAFEHKSIVRAALYMSDAMLTATNFKPIERLQKELAQ